jgi:flavodoxin/predicted small lipoprotein YifL
MHSMVVLLSLLAVLTGCGKEQPVEVPQGGPQGGQEEPSAQVQDGKVLVACFSFTGTTKTAATTLADLTGGTLYLIEPETPYGSENSNYYDKSTRAYQEQYGPASARPAIKKTLEGADGYDIVLLGFPIWYGKAPRVVFSFLDTYSFKGKTVIPFITSGSTGISSAASELKSAYPDLGWKTGDRLNSKTSDELKSWLESLGIKVK